ncbi:hypothetical protein CIW52_12620 [Mycolicibacterium sp. P9-64]|uniref:hypothetical protein n=1 Tax=Mycolicibacterium sp. P9-64 TaxID=2024612 RepID=UPI0011EEE221|nr:hypothetical protein [Mycolicibacterium sp. P9-64]KAA0083273.1 hypothetical protein CIW52_12620 [Mycolicibacterium sp. P9-64]
MVTGTVYRAPARNAHGDPVDTGGNVVRLDDGAALVGTINGVILGGQAVASSRGRQESSDTSGQIGCPTTEAVHLQFGDRIDIRSVRYKVISRPAWDDPSALTGTEFGYAWFDVEATI